MVPTSNRRDKASIADIVKHGTFGLARVHSFPASLLTNMPECSVPT